MRNKSARELHDIGLQHAIDEHAAADRLKLGRLRGGNTGLLLKGQPYGPANSCPRRALLRAKGIDIDPVSLSSQLMFDAGHANEDYFFERVARAWTQDGGTILNEEECPTSWRTDTKVPILDEDGNPTGEVEPCLVSGRPDGLLLAKDGLPVRGIELKGIFSLWRARDVLEGKAKFENLLQSCHYMWQLGLDVYELVYVSRSLYVTNDTANRYLPKYGGEYSEYMNYYYYEWRPKKRGEGLTKGKITEEEYLAGLPNNTKMTVPKSKWQEWKFQAVPASIKQLCVSLELRLVDGALEYRRTDGREQWTKTIITTAGIKDYYEASAELMGSDEMKLTPIPKNVNPDGSTMNYGSCTYCPLKLDCPSLNSVGQLIKRAKEIAGD